ncbi:glycosyltransferase [Reichenbachiella sp.]
MNILYLADPNSIHDLKWIRFFAQQKDINCFLIARSIHVRDASDLTQKLQRDQITYLGSIDDFSIINFIKTLSTANKIYRLQIANHIDHFHMLYAEPNALWTLLRWSKNARYTITTRGTDILKTIPDFFNKNSVFSSLITKLYKKAFFKASQLTSTSTRQVVSVNDLFGDELKVALIRTGVDIEYLQNYTSPNSLVIKDMKREKFIFFPRSMRPIYNHEFTIRALSKLPTAILDEYTMLFVNRDSKDQDYVKYIEQEISQTPRLRARFLTSISQEEMFALYQHAALAIMNPLSDGSPVTAMEAMYLQTPLILGPLEYDKDLFGLVDQINEWDEAELADTIEKMISNGRDQSKLDQLKNTVEEHANWGKEMSKLLDLYTNETD